MTFLVLVLRKLIVTHVLTQILNPMCQLRFSVSSAWYDSCVGWYMSYMCVVIYSGTNQETGSKNLNVERNMNVVHVMTLTQILLQFF